MFNIKKYEVSKATGYVTIAGEYAMWNRPAKEFKESYRSEFDAKRRIERLKTDYILFTLEQYIKVCRELIELKISVNSPGRMLALEKCTTGTHYLQDKQLTSIADTLVKLQPFLKNILPPESNEDFDFLYAIQLRLFTFSTQIINSKANEPCPA